MKEYTEEELKELEAVIYKRRASRGGQSYWKKLTPEQHDAHIKKIHAARKKKAAERRIAKEQTT